MDKQIVERFKLFQEATGRFSDLDIESVVFEKIDYSNEEFFTFIKGQNKYIQKYIKDNAGDVAELGASLTNNCIASYVKPIAETDVIRKECVSFNKDNAKGSRAFYRDYPFVMDRHHIAIIPNNEFINTKYLLTSLDQFLKSKKYGWGENVASVEEIKSYSLKVPVKANQDLDSLELQEVILHFLEFYKSKNDEQLDLIKETLFEIEKVNKLFLPLFFSKNKSIVERFNKFCVERNLDLKFDEIVFESKRILSQDRTEIICEKRMGFTPERALDGDINWFTVRDLTQNKSLFIHEPNTKEKTTFDLIKKTIPTTSPKFAPIMKGDVLISFKLTVGTTKIYTSDIPAYCNEAIDVLTPLPNVDSEYLAYNCQYEYPKFGTKTNNGITLNDDDKKLIEIQIPQETNTFSSISIQKILVDFIGEYLSKLSSLKLELISLEGLFNDYNQTLIHKAFI